MTRRNIYRPTIRRDAPILVVLFLMACALIFLQASFETFDLSRGDPFTKIWLFAPILATLCIFVSIFTLILNSLVTTFEFEAERLKVTEGILVRRLDFIEYYRIKDVSIVRPLHYVIMGICTMTIISSDRSRSMLAIRGLRYSQVAQIEPVLRQAILKCTESGRGREIDIV